ncbi:TOMM precursor leader peptide-binding protein [Streptomyces hirsutus]|uniref:TOMM precursor leader peptide-binding protein n=1 Tax=Streptomyces hirsutus TaxID=35620 RepID=UPI00363EBF1C
MTEAQAPGHGPFVALKRHVRAVPAPGEAVFMWSDTDVTAVRGAGAKALVSLLDGSRTLPELLRDAAAAMPAEEAGRVVRRLAEANLVGYRHTAPCPAGPAGSAGLTGTDPASALGCASPRSDREPAEAYWDRAGLDGFVAEDTVRGTPVALIAVGAVDRDEVRAACRASSITAVDDEEGADAPFALVLCEDYLAPGLRAVEARLRAQGRPWLLARPFAAEPWTGPVFEPGDDDAACWNCLAHRLREHRRGELTARRTLGLDDLRGAGGPDPAPRPAPRPAPSPAAVRALGLHSAVLETAKWLAGLRSPEQRAVCVLDGLTLRTGHHPVRRRPQCPSCGDPALVAERTRRPVVPVSRPKAGGSGSNDRALSAEQLLARHRHLVGPVTGIVTDVRPMAGMPEGLHAYDSGHNLALGGHSPAAVSRVLRSRSSGKGATAVEARASALGEAVERYSAARQGDELTITDSLTGLGPAAVHPNAYQLFHERQYAERDRWNASHTPFHHVCAPFDPGAPTEWTPVWSLTAGTQRLLPTATLYFDTSSGGTRDGLWADSNGNAAGSSPEDALVQGFLELVERDAVALWWYNRLRLPGVDLDAFDEPWLSGLRDALGRAGRQVWALDLTSDLGIPVMAAVSRGAGNTDTAAPVLYGFGAHPDPRLALRRALTEMVQMLPAAGPAATAPAGRPAGAAPGVATGPRTPRTDEQPHLLPDAAQSARAPGAWRWSGRNDDLLTDVEEMRALVAAHGLELLVLDQTRPDVGIPAVKVLVPGLRPFYARFAPGRLYDVPVSLGHFARPLAYEQLNPVPLLL